MEIKRSSYNTSMENLNQESQTITSGRRFTSLKQYEDVKRHSTLELGEERHSTIELGEDLSRHSSLEPREKLSLTTMLVKKLKSKSNASLIV